MTVVLLGRREDKESGKSAMGRQSPRLEQGPCKPGRAKDGWPTGRRKGERKASSLELSEKERIWPC